MLILAFDTCLDKTYIVLRDEEKVISSKIIDKHKGKIEVRSKKNEGSTFIITIPS